MAIVFQQLAGESSVLSDAGNWAAILAATILVLGLVFGWFRQVSHSLHVAGERIALEGHEDGINIILGLNLLNTAGIALSYEVVKFDASIGSDVDSNLIDVNLRDDQRAYVAPQQRLDWHGRPQTVQFYDFPLHIEVRYEVQYGRKSRHLWWWRRALRGSYQAELPAVSQPTIILADPLNGPPMDARVPWTRKTVLGWRL